MKNTVIFKITQLLLILLLISMMAFTANGSEEADEENYLNHMFAARFTFEDGSIIHHATGTVNAMLKIDGGHFSAGATVFYRITALVDCSDGSQQKAYGFIDNRHATCTDETLGAAIITIPINTSKLNAHAETVTLHCSYLIEEMKGFSDTGREYGYFDDQYFDESDIVIARSDLLECKLELRFGEPCAKYTDIDRDGWYHEGVDFVTGMGMFEGVSADRFAPDNLMTRGMLVTVLWRKQGMPEPNWECPFSDVSAGTYYEKAITWAVQERIVKGYSPTVFGPNDPLTREQLAAIIVRYRYIDNTWHMTATKQKDYVDQIKRDELAKHFDDVDQISEYAVNYLWELWTREILKGVDTRELCPKGYATRAQVATILQRYEYTNLIYGWYGLSGWEFVR